MEIRRDYYLEKLIKRKTTVSLRSSPVSEGAANAAVAAEMGRSASSVSRYVQMKDIPTNIRIAVEKLSK